MSRRNGTELSVGSIEKRVKVLGQQFHRSFEGDPILKAIEVGVTMIEGHIKDLHAGKAVPRPVLKQSKRKPPAKKTKAIEA